MQNCKEVKSMEYSLNVEKSVLPDNLVVSKDSFIINDKGETEEYTVRYKRGNRRVIRLYAGYDNKTFVQKLYETKIDSDAAVYVFESSYYGCFETYFE